MAIDDARAGRESVRRILGARIGPPRARSRKRRPRYEIISAIAVSVFMRRVAWHFARGARASHTTHAGNRGRAMLNTHVNCRENIMSMHVGGHSSSSGSHPSSHSQDSSHTSSSSSSSSSHKPSGSGESSNVGGSTAAGGSSDGGASSSDLNTQLQNFMIQVGQQILKSAQDGWANAKDDDDDS